MQVSGFHALLLVAGLAPAGAWAASPAEMACAQLRGTTVAAADIGLPTRGAEVTSATFTPAGMGGAIAHPEFCRVTGAIAPVDPSAPSIRFELNLPSGWNGKSLMIGGGGFDGTIPALTSGVLSQPPAAVVTPLLRGYATFGSDSGHQARPGATPVTAVDGAFATNDEALRNWAGDALKKTSDVAQQLIQRRYGQPSAKRYFMGGSNGGRQALRLLERWPQDVDGAVAAYPFRTAASNAFAYGTIAQAQARPGAYLDPARQALLFHAAIAACDADDGVADGLVSNLAVCRFDPAAIACPKGVDRPDCLTAPQIVALRRYAAPTTVRAEGRVLTYPGFAVFGGVDLRGAQQLGGLPPSSPPRMEMPTTAWFWDSFVRYALTRNPAADPLRIDPNAPGLARRRSELADLMNVDATDLGAFRARGGKLIVYHGTADALVSLQGTVDYWAELEARMGRDAVQSFARFYVVPGYGHGIGGESAFDPQWDPLGVLEAWAERDNPPTALSVVDKSAGGQGRSRPLCEHPTWPRYVGGDVKAASSFTCATPASGSN
jgi:hypothetical protein